MERRIFREDTFQGFPQAEIWHDDTDGKIINHSYNTDRDIKNIIEQVKGLRDNHGSRAMHKGGLMTIAQFPIDLYWKKYAQWERGPCDNWTFDTWFALECNNDPDLKMFCAFGEIPISEIVH